ncbi:hypothetical protein PGIGA_G00214590, partial [Pangasianodon gigas]|nr:hypothetical protein [Pangasianodon gigas]
KCKTFKGPFFGPLGDPLKVLCRSPQQSASLSEMVPRRSLFWKGGRSDWILIPSAHTQKTFSTVSLLVEYRLQVNSLEFQSTSRLQHCSEQLGSQLWKP